MSTTMYLMLTTFGAIFQYLLQSKKVVYKKMDNNGYNEATVKLNLNAVNDFIGTKYLHPFNLK